MKRLDTVVLQTDKKVLLYSKELEKFNLKLEILMTWHIELLSVKLSVVRELKWRFLTENKKFKKY